MQVVLKRGFSAHRFRFAVVDQRAVVHAMCRIVQPAAIAAAELLLQENAVGLRQLADGGDAQRGQFFARARADAVDLAHRQRPQAGRHVGGGEQCDAIRFIQVGTDFRQQLVGCNAHRAGQPGGGVHGLLDVLHQRQCFPVELGEVDIDFVDATVFDIWCDGGNSGLEAA